MVGYFIEYQYKIIFFLFKKIYHWINPVAVNFQTDLKLDAPKCATCHKGNIFIFFFVGNLTAYNKPYHGDIGLCCWSTAAGPPC